MSRATTTEYALGRSPEEYARLTLQARILRPFTERYFRSAGLTPGMRVLDIGAGMGDVSMLAADIVGPSGRVVGVDRDPAVLEHARRRAIEYGCAPWVTFEAADVDTFGSADLFDALVGRYVLLYLPDAAATLRRLLTSVKPGGIVVFHDLDLSDPQPSHPPCALWDQSYRAVRDVFERIGTPLNFGRKLGPTFVGAGLPFPTVALDGPVAGGRGSYLYAWLAATVISVAPRLAPLGLALPPDLEPLDTLAVRLEEEAVRLDGQVCAPLQFAAWARTP
jgi:ubiquinone/menaquinone biosynthesis C-methylase UbiE